MTASPPYSLTRRLTGRVLALVALGWLAAAAGALWVLDHETAETLDDALAHEAQLLAAMADRGAALPSQAGDDRTVRIIGADGVGERPWPAPTPDPAPDPDDGSPAPVWTGAGWAVARAPLADGRSVELGERLDDRRAELLESIRGLVLVMLPVALALMWVIRRTLGQAVRPVAGLSRVLAARDPADLAPLDPAGLPSELAPVATGLNRYLARIQTVLAAERDFAANAAHELRTPVAAARAEAQLLAARPEAATEAQRVIAALDRIAALSERLLQLARAESGVGLARMPVDLTRLLPLVLADLPARPGRPLRYDDGDLDEAVVQGDADGLAILIRNLVENALRHGTGPVRVTLSAGPRLTVRNPAAPGARFRLGRLDRDPASEGTGLGLTIATRLAEQAGARLVTDIVDGTATAVLDWAPGRRD